MVADTVLANTVGKLAEEIIAHELQRHRQRYANGDDHRATPRGRDCGAICTISILYGTKGPCGARFTGVRMAEGVDF